MPPVYFVCYNKSNKRDSVVGEKEKNKKEKNTIDVQRLQSVKRYSIPNGYVYVDSTVVFLFFIVNNISKPKSYDD